MLWAVMLRGLAGDYQHPSGMSVTTFKITWHHKPEDFNQHNTYDYNLKKVNEEENFNEFRIKNTNMLMLHLLKTIQKCTCDTLCDESLANILAKAEKTFASECNG
jgi:hypothetical protein